MQTKQTLTYDELEQETAEQLKGTTLYKYMFILLPFYIHMYTQNDIAV